MDLAWWVALLIGPVVTGLMAGISRAAGTGRIERNGAVGIRLPSTMASDAAWQAGHRAAVAPAGWSFAVLVGLDVVAALLRSHGVPSEPITIALVAAVLLAIVWVGIAANSAAQAAARPTGPA